MEVRSLGILPRQNCLWLTTPQRVLELDVRRTLAHPSVPRSLPLVAHQRRCPLCSAWYGLIISTAFFFPDEISGVTGFLSTIVVGTWGHLIPRRWNLIGGQVLMLVAIVLFALADRPSKYWSYIFPGMIINMIGLGQAYVGASATMMAGAPAGEEGVVGAILYTSFQIGSTVGIAVVSSIALSVNQKQPADALSQFKGYSAAFWSEVAMHGVCIVISVLFVRE